MVIYLLENRIYFDGGLPIDIIEVDDISELSSDIEDANNTNTVNTDCNADNTENVSIAPEASTSNVESTTELNETNCDGVNCNSELPSNALFESQSDNIAAIINDIDDTIFSDISIVKKNVLIAFSCNTNIEKITDSLNDDTIFITYDSDNTFDSVIQNLKDELGDAKLVNIGIIDYGKNITEIICNEMNPFLNELSALQGLDGEINVISIENATITNYDLEITSEGKAEIFLNSNHELTEYFDSDFPLLSTDNNELTTSNEVIFINSSVMDTDKIIGNLPEDAEIVYLDSGEDAIQQITDNLANKTDIDIIRIISHGNEGYFVLNGQIIDSDYVTENADIFYQWRSALSESADIMLYGCNLAASTEGQELVEYLAIYTDADVAASTDSTGSFNGNWNLEYQYGVIEAEKLAINSYDNSLTSYCVTNTSGSVLVENSLSWAVEQSNANPGADEIVFASAIDGNPITTDEELLITDDLTITGNGTSKTIIQAAPSAGTASHRVFLLYDGADSAITVEINNLSIRYGQATSEVEADNLGSGILNYETLTLNNTDISYNTAYAGSGICNFGVLNISYSVVANNTADDNGGGIYNSGTLTITDETAISSNNSKFGGGIYNDGTLTATGGTIISDNEAGTSGGGIYNSKTLTVEDETIISDNIAGQIGGGTCNFLNCTVNNSTIIDNIAYSAGGGIYNDHTITITDSTVSGNLSLAGGGIYNTGTTCTVCSSEITNNTVTVFGGGIFNNGTLTLSALSTISGNIADGEGGGLLNGVNGIITINNSSIMNNTSSYGGGIYNDGSITLSNTTVSGNAASIYGNNVINGFEIPSAYLPDNSPNDLYFNELWGMKNISATITWKSYTGGDIIVAVLDSGVDYTHPDLIDNMWHNPGEIPDNGIDDDNNGYIDDYWGWNFYNNNNDPMDNFSHGTFCAGILGAVGNNGIGVAGICWNVKIMAVKMLSETGTFDDPEEVAEAIIYAVDMGAKILSCSWNSYGFSDVVYSALQYAEANGVLVICSSGNDSNNNDINPDYPASVNLNNVISIAASGTYQDINNLAFFSNYGAVSVDLAAPGVQILSTVPYAVTGKYYDYDNGTSMATPMVAGSAALIWSKFPNLTYSQVKYVLLNGVDVINDLIGTNVTGGRLNLSSTYNLAARLSATSPDNAITQFNDGTQTQTLTSWRNFIDDGVENSIDNKQELIFTNNSLSDFIRLIGDGEYSLLADEIAESVLGNSESVIDLKKHYIGASSNTNQEFNAQFEGIVDISFNLDDSIINYNAIAALNERHPLFMTELDRLLGSI